jgi:hypothetical protein
MPPDVRSGPAGSPIQPSSLTEAESLARTNDVVVIVGDDGQGRQGSGRRRSAPLMFVSLFGPTGRTWWWFTGRCARCGSTTFGRVRHEEDAAGIRRASCGHRVYRTVARVYRLPGSGAAA